MGVKRFETKVIFFQKLFSGITATPYSTKSFTAFNPRQIRETMAIALIEKHAIRYQVLFSNAAEKGINNWSRKNSDLRTSDGFDFLMKKLFFEIKAHPSTRKNYSKAHNLLHKLRTQVRPENMPQEEWEKTRLTENKVLSQIRRILRSGLSPKKAKTGVHVLNSQHGLVIKAYDRDMQAMIKEKEIATEFPFYELVRMEKPFDKHPFSKYLSPYKRLVERKKKNYLNQTKHFKDLLRCDELDKCIDAFTFVHKDGKRYHLNSVQKNDIGLLLQKKFGGILNWEMGSGKTCASWAAHQLIGSNYRNTVIVGPPIAIKLTFIPFLDRQNASYRVIDSISAIDQIKEGDVVVIALTMVVKYQRFIKRFLKTIGNKALLIFDESDEITNYSSKRSRAVRSTFRKVKFKLQTTGTTTRNNIAEIYGQLELLHNNSYTFQCTAPMVYKETRLPDAGLVINSQVNANYQKPFPGRGGNQLFKSCYSPTKSTVFGISKHNQDIYNTDSLEALVGSCILTRKFNDVVGHGKYEIHTHTISQKQWEIDFYFKILEEFHELLPQFYSSTGSARKDSMLRLLRQLQTLIDACSFPQLMAKVNEAPEKGDHIIRMLSGINTRIMIGCRKKKAARLYLNLVQEQFPDRPVFFITGSKGNFKKRQLIIDQFESTENGILVCTQQSLSSSVNISRCSEVVIESLPWNLARASQFYFRTIRFDSEQKTNIHFVVYENSIEINLMALLLDKERLNDFIKTQQFRSVEEVFGDFKLNVSFLEMLIEKVKDEEGNTTIKWGKQHRQVA
jgi:hypothetical protein